MKKVLLSIALLAAFSQTKAQGTLEKGRAQINAGVGLSGWGIPVYAGFDYGLGKSFTIGAEGSFRSYDNIGYSFTIIGVVGNVNYHLNNVLNMPKNMDLYGGLNIGYYIYSTPSGYLGNSLSTLGISGQVGYRYFFSNSFGVNVELGGGSATSGAKLGVTIKL